MLWVQSIYLVYSYKKLSVGFEMFILKLDIYSENIIWRKT